MLDIQQFAMCPWIYYNNKKKHAKKYDKSKVRHEHDLNNDILHFFLPLASKPSSGSIKFSPFLILFNFVVKLVNRFILSIWIWISYWLCSFLFHRNVDKHIRLMRAISLWRINFSSSIQIYPQNRPLMIVFVLCFLVAGKIQNN